MNTMVRRPLQLAFLLLVCLLPREGYGQDVVIAPGAGAPPLIRVLHADGTQTSFYAYNPSFPGGVNVALGDVNGDGVPDIITGAGPGGGPHVQVFSGTDLSVLASFFAYAPSFTGGVYVAAGDVDGDGHADIITGAGAGGGPHVQVFSGANFSVMASFFAYAPSFPGGVFVASGDFDGDGHADIVTGAGAGGGPHVQVFSGANFSVVASFFAYNPAFTGGVSVGAVDINGDGRPELITGAGPGGGPHVQIFSSDFQVVLSSFMAFDPNFTGGVFIGSMPGGRTALRITSAPNATFTVGSMGTFEVKTLGGTGGITLTETGALPGGVTFTNNGNGTATLTGTPAAGTGGTYPLTLTATDGNGKSA